MTKISMLYFVNRYVSFMVKYLFLPFIVLLCIFSNKHAFFYIVSAAILYVAYFSFFPWFPMRQVDVYIDKTVLVIIEGRKRKIIDCDAVEEIYYRTSTTNLGKPWAIQICLLYDTNKFANFFYLIPYEQRYFKDTHEYSNNGVFLDGVENFYRMTNNFFISVPISKIKGTMNILQKY